MLRALYAFAQGCPLRICLTGALLLLVAPAVQAGTSNQQNPVVTFTSPGVKQVTLQACNAGGCSSVTKNVTVLAPQPAVTSASFAPPTPEAGQLVLLTGSGTGKPPLTFTWRVALLGIPLLDLPGPSVWWNTVGLPSGLFTVSLQIQNSAGTATSSPLSLTLAPATTLDFYTIPPCRIYDSRLVPAPLLSGVARIIQATGTCGIPAGARAVAANVTVITPTSAGFATLYPGNYPQPVASTVHFAAGLTRSSQAILPLATNGTGTLASLVSLAGAGGSAHLAIDVSGYFRP
jgi:hypothetical protein